MDPGIQELLKKYNEEHKIPLSEEELEEMEIEEFISKMPGGGDPPLDHLEGADTTVDHPFNYGMTALRGSLNEIDWELIDTQPVREEVARRLDVHLEDVERIYGPGGKTKLDLEIRAEIDEKLLRAVEGGVSKVLLARAMGWGLRKPHNQAPVLQKALKRARKARG